MTTLKDTPRGRKPIHSKFIAAFSGAKVGQIVKVSLPTTLPTLTGKTLKSTEDIALNYRGRLLTTINYHFSDELNKQGLRVRSKSDGSKLAFWKEKGERPKRGSRKPVAKKKVSRKKATAKAAKA